METSVKKKPNVLDPVTFEIVRHKLWSINQEGSITMEHVSGSPVVQATDYNFGIYTAEGEMAVIGVYLLTPIYTGYMAIQEFIKRFDVIEPGDVFIINDPFIAAQHQNDVQFCAPFFYKDKLIAWTGCMAHQVDLGGAEPGSWCPNATDVFQEGVLIPPAKIVSAGKINQGLWNMIISNSRMPFTVSNDFTAFLAAHRVAQERLTELCEKYGEDIVVQVMDQSINTSEKEFRDLLKSLPNGVYEDTSYLDQGNTGEILTVQCRMTKEDDHLTFDFNGSSPQTVGYGNSTLAATMGSIATVVLAIFGSEIQWNHGLMRPIKVLADDGQCVTAVSPAPISGGAAAASWTAMTAANGCISKMLSFSEIYASYACSPGDGSWQLAQFGGLNQNGEPYAAMYMDALLWGGTAFPFRDGVDSGGAMVILGGGAQDVEQQESQQPLLYLWRREVANSAGVGEFRGGNGIEFALTPIDTEEVIGTLATHGITIPIRTGVFGGFPAMNPQYELVRGANTLEKMKLGNDITNLTEIGGEHQVLGSVTTGLSIKKGDIVNIRVQSGGGYGDPLNRDPERVLKDLMMNAISLDVAQKFYGVVVHDGKVDKQATSELREELLNKRIKTMVPPKSFNVTEELKNSKQVLKWGAVLNLHQHHGDVGVSCVKCDHYLGDLVEDWKDLAGIIKLDSREMGSSINMDERMAAEHYICPNCGTSLWIDILQKDSKRPIDFRFFEKLQ